MPSRTRSVLRRRLVTPVFMAATLLVLATPAGAKHGDIHARCEGDKPVVTSRPPGTEYIKVVCVNGLPEFMVESEPVPVYDPISEVHRIKPPDFGGWVTVWLNGHPLKAPYDPIRRMQEPGAYFAASTQRVMVPIRFVSEAFGGKVEWNQQRQRVQVHLPQRERVVQVWVGDTRAMINFTIHTLDQGPVVFQDRVFVPIRFLAEGLGADVKWDQTNSSVRVELKGAGCQSPTYCGGVR